jgi:hypothetical protein
MKRTVCRRTKSGKFAKSSACKGYKKTKVTVRKQKAGQWLFNW